MQEESKLKTYLSSVGLKYSHFSKLCGVSVSTLHGLYHGITLKIQRRNAVKIVKFSNGKLKLEDFGHA